MKRGPRSRLDISRMGLMGLLTARAAAMAAAQPPVTPRVGSPKTAAGSTRRPNKEARRQACWIQTLDRLRNLMGEMGVRPSEMKKDDGVSLWTMVVMGTPYCGVVPIHVLVNHEEIEISSMLPSGITHDKFAEISELCGLINGGFVKFGRLYVEAEMTDEGTHFVEYEVIIPYADCKRRDADRKMRTFFHAAVHTFDVFASAFTHVSMGTMSPREAFESAMRTFWEKTSSPDSREKEAHSKPRKMGDGAASPSHAGSDNLVDGYSTEGLNLVTRGVDLNSVVAAVTRFTRKDLGHRPAHCNILLSGPPGTGKTEFVKYLAAQARRPVITLKGSDVICKFVGETEKRIAEAFRKAEESDAILFLDEVDGLMRGRANAQTSWEVSQVVELLQQMDRFSGVFVAATNHEDCIDRASLRRFVFKLELGYLKPAGVVHFFRRVLGQKMLSTVERTRLEAIRNLTPGDFATVKTKLAFLMEHPSSLDYIKALEGESAAKALGTDTAKPIGFAS